MTDSFARISGTVLGIGYFILAFHPVTMAAHYRLWSREGRSIYSSKGKDYPYATGQEIAIFVLSLLLASGIGFILSN